MSWFAKVRFFQKVASGILIIFMGIMLFVVVIVYSRPSGATKQDMAKAQIFRKQAIVNKN